MRNSKLCLVSSQGVGVSKPPMNLAAALSLLTPVALFVAIAYFVAHTQYGWFTSIQEPETAVAAKAGLFERMAKLGIASIERQGDALNVTLVDGTETSTRVCAWNNFGGMLSGCNQSSGRYYKLSAGPSPTYRGAAHEQDESAEYVLSWLQSDLDAAERVTAAATETRSASHAAAASWKN